MKTIEVSESALESLKAMAQKLQEERDMLLAVAHYAMAVLTDKRIGTWPYMEGTEIYNDFDKAANKLKTAIAACQESTKVMES